MGFRVVCLCLDSGGWTGEQRLKGIRDECLSGLSGGGTGYQCNGRHSYSLALLLHRVVWKSRLSVCG